MDKYKYCLSLNFEGNDYQIEVSDLHTANLLLNDAAAAEQYMNELLNSQSILDNEREKEAQILAHDEPQSQILEPVYSNSLSTEIIWSRKKPTDKDNEATKLMLSMREKLGHLFDDKKTRKAKLWSDICKKLEENKFNLGEKGGERCRQKFANLQKSYLAYVKHQKTTGSEKNDDLPPFFEELHSILGSKHKVNPITLEDSMEIGDTVTTSDNENETEQKNEDKNREHEQEDTENLMDETTAGETTLITTPTRVSPIPSTSSLSNSSAASNRFKKGTRKVTPSRNDDIIKEIEKDRAVRNEEFSFLKAHLLKSEKQKDRFLEILEVAFAVKKRRREDSSDSE